MASPLKGIQVLELGQFIAGPFMGLQLADLGAEVIKIEKPGEGEAFRAFGANPKMAGYSHNFCAFNRNKKSVTLDLADPRGAALFRKMAAKADVVIENFRSGVMQRLGIDYEVLRAINPRLVYGSIVGFAEDGPNRGQPAYDTVAQAMSGMLTLFLDPEDPRIIGPTIADQVTGMQCAAGIIAALFERERTGKGARIDITLVEASMYLMPDSFTAYTHAGLAMGPESRAAFSLSLAFACKDGMIAMHVSSIEKFWRAMLAAIERPDLADDPRFNNRLSRIKNFQTLIAELRPVFATKSRDALMQRMAAGQVPAAKVNGIPEAMNDPEVRHLGLFHETTHPKYGAMTAMHRSVRIDGQREADPTPPPALGEHTESVLAALGLGQSEIAELRAKGIV